MVFLASAGVRVKESSGVSQKATDPKQSERIVPAPILSDQHFLSHELSSNAASTSLRWHRIQDNAGEQAVSGGFPGGVVLSLGLGILLAGECHVTYEGALPSANLL